MHKNKINFQIAKTPNLPLICHNHGQFEQSICGIYFACIARTCSLGMIHLLMNYYENICGPHYGQCTIFVIILTVRFLCVNMFNVFNTYYGIQCLYDGRLKALVFLISYAFGKLVFMPLQNALHKLLIFYNIIFIIK